MYSAKARVGDEKLIKRKLSILEPERKKEKKRDLVFSEIAFISSDLVFRVMLFPLSIHFVSKKDKGVIGSTQSRSEVC